MSRASIIFEDVNDTLEMRIEFDSAPDDNSSAHLAAAAVYVEATKKLGEMDNADATEA